MGKRDFVDHCDFVDPVGEFNSQSRLTCKSRLDSYNAK